MSLARAALGAGLLVLLSGCGAGGNRQESAELAFRVDSTRLDAAFVDSATALSLRVPAGWSALPEAALAEFGRRSRETSGADSLRLPTVLALYLEQGSGSSLVVSSFRGRVEPAARDSLALDQIRGLRSRSGGLTVDEGRFSHGGFEILQLRWMDSGRVVYRLLLGAGAREVIQLDYILPRAVYTQQLPSVESSIGTLHSLNRKS